MTWEEGTMTTSRYIARLMGPALLVIGIGIVFGLMMEGPGYSSLMKEFIADRAVIFLTGILALLAGLAIVNAHNLWVPDWRVIVTVLGWLLVLRGIMLLVFPLTVQVFVDRIAASQAGVIAAKLRGGSGPDDSRRLTGGGRGLHSPRPRGALAAESPLPHS
jgi:hypothetical protein